MKKTNLEMLREGIKHIAKNHNARFYDEIDTDRQICIMDNSVPTLADVSFLCNDLNLDMRNIHSTVFGIDVDVTNDWLENHAKEEFKGLCLWQSA